MALVKKPILRVKRGDDFSIDLTVKDTNNEIAIAAQADLTAASLAYTNLIAVVPQDPVAIAAAVVTLEAAQLAYDTAIIVDITNWEITSHLGWCGKFVSAFVVTITDGPLGKFAISAAKEVTELWKIKTYEADIEFNYPLFGRKSSQTMLIEVVRDITNG